MNSNDDKADIVDKFIHVLNLKSNSIFSDSAYQINERIKMLFGINKFLNDS